MGERAAAEAVRRHDPDPHLRRGTRPLWAYRRPRSGLECRQQGPRLVHFVGMSRCRSRAKNVKAGKARSQNEADHTRAHHQRRRNAFWQSAIVCMAKKCAAFFAVGAMCTSTIFEMTIFGSLNSLRQKAGG